MPQVNQCKNFTKIIHGFPLPCKTINQTIFFMSISSLIQVKIINNNFKIKLK